jgi:TusA-related sulfurtransferase
MVRTKKGMDSIQSGEVLELLATDRGSLSDVKAWAQNGRHQLLQTLVEDGVLKFYIQKA